MKQLAVIVAALLSLTLVAPALAQPFADVPTDHWAYDAIAELAAKGLIEGYPDGAFRGDRAMTRYEMAMVVARLLARIEAIKIPPLPPDLARTKDVAAVAAALAATDKRLTAKLATVQRLVAEFRAELAALGVRVTAVEEELAAIRARLDNTRINGDMRFRYNVYEQGSASGSATFRQPDARLRARITFTGSVSPNTQAVVRLWAANNGACDQTGAVEPTGVPTSCGGNLDVRFGHNYNFNVVTFDWLYLDVRNTWGATLWRVGRQPFTLAGLGPFGVGLLYDPNNNVGVASQFSTTPIMGTAGPGSSDGIRGDFALGPVNIRAAVFRQSVFAFAAGSTPLGVQPGVGSAPGLDHRMVELSTGAFLPGWTLAATYYQAFQNPTCTGVNCSGGTGYSVSIAGTLLPGLSIYGEVAWWGSIPTVGAAELSRATAYRIGGNLNIAQLTGVTSWNPNLDFEYHRYGPMPAGGIAPVENYATTILGQVFSWNMDGWLLRLNLTFSQQTRLWILYEGGNMLCANSACSAPGGNFSEWWIRLTHLVRPNTTVALNYFKANNATIGTPGFAGDYVNFYRAELLYNW